MKSLKYITRTSFTFLKWERKGYAVFASLGRLIRIGKLSISISQNFISKNEVKTGLLSPNQDTSDENPAGKESVSDPGELLLLTNRFALAVSSTQKSDIHLKALVPFRGLIHHIFFLIKVHFLLYARNGLFNLYRI